MPSFNSEDELSEEHHHFIRRLHRGSILDYFRPTRRQERRLGFDSAYHVEHFSREIKKVSNRRVFNLFFQYKLSQPQHDPRAIGYRQWAPKHIPFMSCDLHNTTRHEQLNALVALDRTFSREQVFYCTNRVHELRAYLRPRLSIQEHRDLFLYLPVHASLRRHRKMTHHHQQTRHVWLHSRPEKQLLRPPMDMDRIRQMKDLPNIRQAIQQVTEVARQVSEADYLKLSRVRNTSLSQAASEQNDFTHLASEAFLAQYILQKNDIHWIPLPFSMPS